MLFRPRSLVFVAMACFQGTQFSSYQWGGQEKEREGERRRERNPPPPPPEDYLVSSSYSSSSFFFFFFCPPGVAEERGVTSIQAKSDWGVLEQVQISSKKVGVTIIIRPHNMVKITSSSEIEQQQQNKISHGHAQLVVDTLRAHVRSQNSAHWG